jgi:hypothetical protein
VGEGCCRGGVEDGLDRFVRVNGAAVGEGDVREEEQLAGEEPECAEDERAREATLAGAGVGDILLGNDGRHALSVSTRAG